MVCLPKKEGGLGVLNMKTQNDALLLKHLHKFFNRVDTLWVQLVWELHYSNGTLPSITRKKGSFWWRDILKLLDSYKGLAMVNIRDGASCLLWDGLWLHRVPSQRFPELFSFAKKIHISVSSAISAGGLASLFHLPISNQALQQLITLAEDLNSVQDLDEKDIWSYIWGSPFYSSAKAYKHLTGHRVVNDAFRWLWNSSCQNKHKVFFWLLMKDRLSTRELLRRRNMELPDYTSVCCSQQVDESSTHLFIFCPFAQACWGLLDLPIDQEGPFAALEQFRTQLHVPFFMEIIIVMSWCIWMQRNNLIFSRNPAITRGLLAALQERICLSYPKSKHQKATIDVLMARSPCVIFFIFFAFFVS